MRRFLYCAVRHLVLTAGLNNAPKTIKKKGSRRRWGSRSRCFAGTVASPERQGRSSMGNLFMSFYITFPRWWKVSSVYCLIPYRSPPCLVDGVLRVSTGGALFPHSQRAPLTLPPRTTLGSRHPYWRSSGAEKEALSHHCMVVRLAIHTVYIHICPTSILSARALPPRLTLKTCQ